jgi:cell division protease FtsH
MTNWLKNRKFVVAAALVVVIGLLGLSIFMVRNTQVEVKTVPISEVINRADTQQIKEAVITGNVVTVTDVNGKKFEAVKEDTSTISEVLRKDGVEVTVDTAQPNLWAVPIFSIVIFGVLGGVLFLSTRKNGLGGGQGQMFSFGKSRARVFGDDRPTITFDDVAGVEEAKYELAEVVQFLKYPQKFVTLGARIPKGVLLVGPPGTGKTLISKAVAGEAGVPFFSISASEFVEMFVGVGASRVRDLFRQARKSAPCIVFIDEIDAVGRQRGVNLGGGNDEREQTLNQLLVEMDGFDTDANVVIIAATNRTDILDKALLRPGRFDRQVALDTPDIAARKAILTVHAKGKPLEDAIDLGTIAQQTPGFSGADLANLINEAAILSARTDKQSIGKAELEESILRVMAGPERKSRVIGDDEKSIIAYHEVGHALVMKSMHNADPVHKVSIMSRGQALGITVQMPKEDRYLISKSQLLAKMAGAMGGRAAEELVFGDITTGAKQDIDYVTRIARRMVCEFGMSDLGSVSFNRVVDEMGMQESISDAIATKIDHHVIQLVEEAYSAAKRILNEKMGKLVEIAELLKKEETIDGRRLDTLLALPIAACLPAEPVDQPSSFPSERP